MIVRTPSKCASWLLYRVHYMIALSQHFPQPITEHRVCATYQPEPIKVRIHTTTFVSRKLAIGESKTHNQTFETFTVKVTLYTTMLVLCVIAASLDITNIDRWAQVHASDLHAFIQQILAKLILKK